MFGSSTLFMFGVTIVASYCRHAVVAAVRIETNKPPSKTEVRAMSNVRSFSDISPNLWGIL
jgi:hypothetical protein